MESVSSISNRLFAQGKFRHIQLLLKLAELGSVKRTSEEVGMTQSAVTQTLAYIEKMAGAPLFHRHARGINPTQVCAGLLPVARHLMQGIQDSAEVLHARQRSGLKTVRLMASAAATNGLLIHALPRFHKLNPTVQVQLREAENDDLLLAISRKEVDLVVCRHPASIPKGWAFTPLYPDRLAVVVSAKHPLVKKQKMQWGDLANECWILSPAGSVARTRLEEIAQAHEFTLNAYPLVTRSVTLLGALIAQEKVVALLPLSVVHPQINSGELKELHLMKDVPIAPLGTIMPLEEAGQATLDLASFLVREYPA